MSPSRSHSQLKLVNGVKNMRTFLFWFALSFIFVCFNAPELALCSTPPPANNDVPILGDGGPTHRRYARSLANADAGEPRTVRLIYLLPNDRDFRPEVVQRMKEEIRRIQTFYREQMQAHGQGARTFRVETDAQGEPVVHRVDGQYRNSYYQRSDVAGTTLPEIEPKFDLYANIYMIVIDNHRKRIGPLFGVRGYGIKHNKIAGYTLLPGAFEFEVAAHELGHAFGLHHDFRDDAYIMSYGEGSDELSECSASFLSVHTYFDSDVPLDRDSRPTLELISPLQYPEGTERVSVEFKVNDANGLHQALLFSTTRRPHKAEGFPEVVSCLHFSGETSATAEFDYDGVLASSGFGSVAEWPTHPITLVVVDRHGNAAGESILLSEAKPGRIFTIETPTFNPKSLTLSRNGTLIAASGSAVSESNEYSPQVWLWERTTGARIAMIDQAASVALSPDGSTLAYGSWPGDITLRAVKSQEETDWLYGHTLWSNVLAFSPDGRTLASGSHDRTVKLWDVSSGTMIVSLGAHRDIVNSVAFSTDGRRLASGSEDTTVKLWDVVTRTEVDTLEGHSNAVRSVAFSPNGATLASVVVDGNVVLWDVDARAIIARYRVDSGIAHSVGYSPNGILAAGGGRNKSVLLLDTTTGEAVDPLLNREPINSIAISGDGSVLATCTSNDRSGRIELWDLSVLSARSDEIVPDARLRTVLRISFDKPAGAPIGLEDLAMLRSVDGDDASIFALAGLEFATNLAYLALGENNIVNLSPIAGLTNLDRLFLQRNNISDIAPLARLTNLITLHLYDNNTISDIYPLRGLTKLNVLFLTNNIVSDITPLSALINLERLYLAGNKVSDTSALTGLTKLITLHLAVNSISDISPLVANPGLGEGDTLFLRRNPLNYEAVNSHIPLLQDRGVTVSFIDRTPTTLEPISGDEQQGASSELLGDPFVVEVRDEHGDVFEGVPVTFHVPDGVGRLSATNTTTDADGRAQSVLTLGQRAGKIIVTVSAAEITEIGKLVTFIVVSEETPPRIPGDVNGDSVVNVFDLVQVAANFAETGENDADVNGDGVVDVLDLLQVAEAIGGDGAAPSVYSSALSVFSAAEIESWIAQARGLNLMDARLERGIRFLEQLLAVLTPDETALLPNYPNPFNPETWIPYHLANEAKVAITIYDAKGALVRRLALGNQAAGYYAERGKAAYWDGRNEDGEPVASGIYMYQFQAGDYAASRRMVIVK